MKYLNLFVLRERLFNCIEQRQFFVALCVCLIAPGQLLAATATVEHLSGNPAVYEVGSAGARKVSLVREGAELKLPLEIETRAGDSVALRLPDGLVTVAPGSSMRIPVPETTEQGLLQRVLHDLGNALFVVDRKDVEHFQVETPHLVSVVKGTTFSVVVHDSGATVSLLEGRLLVLTSDGQEQVDLRAGDAAFTDALGDLHHLPGFHESSAPPALLPADGAISGRHQVRVSADPNQQSRAVRPARVAVQKIGRAHV